MSELGDRARLRQPTASFITFLFADRLLPEPRSWDKYIIPTVGTPVGYEPLKALLLAVALWDLREQNAVALESETISSRRVTTLRGGSLKRGNQLEFASVRLLEARDGVGVEGAVVRKLAQRRSALCPVAKLKRLAPTGCALQEGVDAGVLRRTGPSRVLLQDRVGVSLGLWSVSDPGFAHALEPRFAEVSASWERFAADELHLHELLKRSCAAAVYSPS